MDVRENTAGRDRDRAQELVELLVVADGELDVARHDARLLVVARGVARELEDLGAPPGTGGQPWTPTTSSRRTWPCPCRGHLYLCQT